MHKILFLFLFIVGLQTGFSQEPTRRDTLMGGLPFERTSFDVLRYNIAIQITPETKKIAGHNEIIFKVVANTQKIQIDLFENMVIDSILWNANKLSFKREYDAVFLKFPTILEKESIQAIKVYYHGTPIIAKNAPWDGGFVFATDSNKKPFIGVAVQGTGASLWCPVKDSQSDEPDHGVSIKVAVPDGLMNVSNGRFVGSEKLNNGYTRWDWEVKNPINAYNITINVGDYVSIHDTHNGLDLDYYVLRDNKEKAIKHFEDDVKPMLDCFQSKFGKYPFWEDGYKLVESPYLGMEHQSAVAYGNKYRKGYLGTDTSGTGIGMKFDFITIHESGHEWFGNSITSKDIADMWIHEGFTTYTETVFVECTQGYEEAMQYINGQAKRVQNNKPIIGQFGVNRQGSSDMYYKGALLLNTLRHIVNDDAKWWSVLLNYSETYKKQIIDTDTVIAFFNQAIEKNLTPVFKQYLNHTALPVLEIKPYKKSFQYRWKTDETNFEMPVDVVIRAKLVRLNGTNKWTKSNEKISKLDVIQVLTDRFYIKVK